jgi:outer membrane protein TolC
LVGLKSPLINCLIAILYLQERLKDKKAQATLSGGEVNDREILQDVLGRPRGYNRGVGGGALPLRDTNDARRIRTQLDRERAQWEEARAQLETTIESMRNEMEDLKKNQEEQDKRLNAFMEQFMSSSQGRENQIS